MWWSLWRCRLAIIELVMKASAFQACCTVRRARAGRPRSPLQPVVFDVVDGLQQKDRVGRLHDPEQQRQRPQPRSGQDASHAPCAAVAHSQRAAHPASAQSPQLLRLQAPGAGPAAGQRARQEAPEALASPRRRRVLEGRGSRVVAAVMLDHEVRVVDAGHQRPGRVRGPGASARWPSSCGEGDALAAGDTARHPGPAPARPRGRGLAAWRPMPSPSASSAACSGTCSRKQTRCQAVWVTAGGDCCSAGNTLGQRHQHLDRRAGRPRRPRETPGPLRPPTPATARASAWRYFFQSIMAASSAASAASGLRDNPHMNPLLARLHPYPFERWRELTRDIVPAPAWRPSAWASANRGTPRRR